jgi:2-dehydro-3-deoxyphosphogluconate aldolase / (4S)-4-hydroxy-2-oxoglutarate aldolase
MGKKMDSLERIGLSGLVPVVVLEDADDALPAAEALLAGGLDIMEITMRTKVALDCIIKVKEKFPNMLVGAGTVRSVGQAADSVKAGAEFVVTPGFDETVVKWCIDSGIAVTPGCVTPTEIEFADKYGLDVLKFFPANVYGGVEALKALNGPYRNKKFIPTGGVDLANLKDFADKEFVFAVGGGFLCSPSSVAAKTFVKITDAAKQAIAIMLGFELAHIGINTPDGQTAMEGALMFDRAFSLGIKEGESSNFVGSIIEINKKTGFGQNGHIAIRTNNIARAIYYLGKRGFEVDMSTVKEKNGKTAAVYLKEHISGFAIHLLQK